MDDSLAHETALAAARLREEKLQQRVDELTDFVERASLPLHWVDSKGIIIWANQAELELLGYQAEEYIGKRIIDFHADQPVINDILRRLTSDETLLNYPARLLTKAGSIRHVLINSNVRRNDGEFVHTRCFTRDITAFVLEQARTAQVMDELEQAEARLRMAMESTGMGTWEYLPAEGHLTWSDECRRIYGIPLEIPVNFDLFTSLIHHQDKKMVEAKVGAALDSAGTGLYDITFRILRYDTIDVRWIRSQGKVYFETGSPQRFIGTVIDITDIKLAEEKSAKLSAIVKSSNDAIISRDLDGLITSWNASAEEMFGYSDAEMIGQPLRRLIPPDRVDEDNMMLEKLRNGERISHFETKRLTKDGGILDVSLSISPLRDSLGNIIGISKIARDITSKKQEEMRKNDFIAMVSHELKTPLTSIKTYIQVLLHKAKHTGDAFMVTALSRADVQSQKMGTMIHDFLTMARLQEGKLFITKADFPLFDLMDEITGDARFLSPHHEIQLEPCGNISVHADRDKVGQVLMNLLTNAIKYSPRKGKVTIGCRQEADHAVIYVTDHGVGISKSDQQRLFERFFRSNNDNTKTVSGFGIGLYLVAEILRYHDSTIQVQSEEGKGSTFTFKLKIAGI